MEESTIGSPTGSEDVDFVGALRARRVWALAVALCAMCPWYAGRTGLGTIWWAEPHVGACLSSWPHMDRLTPVVQMGRLYSSRVTPGEGFRPPAPHAHCSGGGASVALPRSRRSPFGFLTLPTTSGGVSRGRR
eukprot:TRINITY_DN4476_c0_g1_i1.p1 TRINITY_DN4476_c0_g1~~TRINITY_DN4476_c0_g1_i1.p1  ORF type:complete len:133 (-),score=3.38 TRINITY_DN4476_c0_g1_i1:128-526(-)